MQEEEKVGRVTGKNPGGSKQFMAIKLFLCRIFPSFNGLKTDIKQCLGLIVLFSKGNTFSVNSLF